MLKSIYSSALFFLFSSNSLLASNSDELIIINAKEVVTLDQEIEITEAIVVRDDRILDFGKYKKLIQKYPNASLDNRYKDDVIVPGFIEHHIHPFLSAITMNAEIIAIEGWSLPNNQSKAYRDRTAYLDRLNEIEESMEDNSPLVTWGFHHYFHGELTRDDLDKIS